MTDERTKIDCYFNTLKEKKNIRNLILIVTTTYSAWIFRCHSYLFVSRFVSSFLCAFKKKSPKSIAKIKERKRKRNKEQKKKWRWKENTNVFTYFLVCVPSTSFNVEIEAKTCCPFVIFCIQYETLTNDTIPLNWWPMKKFPTFKPAEPASRK